MITLFTEKLFLSLSVKKSCKVVKFLIKQLNFGDFLRPTMYIVERFQLMVDVFVTRCSCGTGETSVYQGTSRNVIFVHLKLTKYIIRPPGTVVPGGLMFCCGFFFLSCGTLRRYISEMAGAIALKLSHMIGSV